MRRWWWRLQYEHPCLGASAAAGLIGIIGFGKFEDVRAGLIAAAVAFAGFLLLFVRQRKRWATLDEYLAAAEHDFERAEHRRRAARWWNRPSSDLANPSGEFCAVTEVGPKDVLHQHRSAGQVTIVGAEEQVHVRLPVRLVELLTVKERAALRTAGKPAWFRPEAVRNDLRLIEGRADAADYSLIDQAVHMVDYACSTGTGIAVVPPPESA